MELWVCRGRNCPRLHLRAITFFGLGLWTPQEQVGLAHKLLGPTIAPQNPAIRLLGWKGGFWKTQVFNMAYLIQPCINVCGFPLVQETRRFTRYSL